MFKLFKKQAPDTSILDAINHLHQQMDFRFKELSSQVQELELKLMTKDLKDKQAYGLLHYKLHEAKNPKLEDEISDLEKKLKQN
jgi:DNA-binding HxlR family transcriptional regulator